MAKNLAGRVLDNITLSEVSDPIGAIAQSELNEEEFNNENLGTWYLLDGRSAVGTAYATVRNKTVIPDAITDGSFLRQAKDGREAGTNEGDAIRNITGSFDAQGYPYSPGGDSSEGAFQLESRGYVNSSYSGSATYERNRSFDASRVVPTADENRPHNVAINFYIKVDY